ncbi:hypothetical protein BGW36DRAFT_356891 [Talaromyces proteolyticus]|uniref:FAD-dependent oxidoreductase 2 FAD-binding domain-containing protein n=1 Tax=Talaromyces proteolyticus TaxID=1131652 RepID=A0AAD4KSQ5_9EURO|nr:uncharacterized protein BGW36DRAFT_356891 [Talaromyces proteolyticus]KAH8700228.1 hypothetical protein BGW36DRAFT_356891 [Talaromyces proteolyticus]
MEWKVLFVKAKRGVILASGGFGRSPEARNYVPHEWCIRLEAMSVMESGLELKVAVMLETNTETVRFPPLYQSCDPRRALCGDILISRSIARSQGSIIVGPNGKQFANDFEPYQDFAGMMHNKRIKKAFMITDKHFLRKYGKGNIALPRPYPIFRLLRQRYLSQAPTIASLMM